MTTRKKNLKWVLSSVILGLLAGCSDGDSSDSAASTHELSSVTTTPVPSASSPAAADPQLVAQIRQWREQRQEELLAPRGLANLIGLYWLERDTHYVGSGASNSLRLDLGPEKLGLLTRRSGQIWFTPQTLSTDIQVDDKPLTERILLHPEGSPAPTIITFDQGAGAISLIREGQRAGLYLTYAENASFSGLEYWPISTHWRITGAFLPHETDKTITLTDASGYPVTLGNPGTVEFNHNGQPVRLEVFSDLERPFFTIFFSLSNEGNRLNSRYLDFDPPHADGRMVLDFNRSYNPPCAFSHSVACLLPPSGNYLNFAIEAGEKNYHPQEAIILEPPSKNDMDASMPAPTADLTPTTTANWR